MKNPCYKCANRRFKCHAECEKYKAWLDNFRDKRKAARGISAYTCERRSRLESKMQKGNRKYKSYFKG